jgi:hypothetical protein
VCAKINGTDRSAPHSSARERGGARVGADRQGPPIKDRGHANTGERAGLGLMG